MRLVGPKNSRRRAIVVTLACVLALLVIGDAVPKAILYTLHSRATDLAFATRAVDPEARVNPTLLGAAAAGSTDADFPAHQPARVPLEVETQLESERAQADPDDPATKNKATRIDAHRSVRAQDSELARLIDRVFVERASTFPVAFPTSRLGVELPAADYRQQTGDFVRQGVTYVFPPDTEKRSYPFFNPWLMDFAYLDYRGKAPADPADPDMSALVFGQRITGHRLSQTLSALGTPERDARDALSVTGPAADWYTPDELRARGLKGADQLTLEPFYSVDREVKVEPQSGRIISISERINIYLGEPGGPAECADGTTARPACGPDEEALAPGGPRAVEKLAAARMADPSAADAAGSASRPESGSAPGSAADDRGVIIADGRADSRSPIRTGDDGEATVAAPEPAHQRIRAEGARTLVAAETSWDQATRAEQRAAAHQVIRTRQALAVVALLARILMVIVVIVGIREFLRRRPA